VVLAAVFLLPAAIALHAGAQRMAIVAGALAIAAYYALVLRSAAASRILHLPADARVPDGPP
jgi:hypothetical protein